MANEPREVDILFRLIVQEIGRLRPDHELQEFAVALLESAWTDDVRLRFFQRFDKNNNRKANEILKRFLYALRKANRNTQPQAKVDECAQTA